MRGPARLAVLALALALLAACSLMRVGYGQMGTFAAWKADEYFNLDSRQEQEFRERFARLHRWHRTEQLPDYASFLASASGRVQKGLTLEDALWITEQAEARYRTMVRRGADDAAALLMTITPAQLETLQRQWEKDNARYAREHRVGGTPQEQRAARGERELKRIREWVGELTAEQERRIVALADQMPLAPKLHHEDRKRRQREFLQLMATRGADERQFADRLRHFLANWEEGRDPEYHRLATDWRRKRAEFYVAAVRMLTPEQRTTLVQRVENYAQDFTQLAQR